MRSDPVSFVPTSRAMSVRTEVLERPVTRRRGIVDDGRHRPEGGFAGVEEPLDGFSVAHVELLRDTGATCRLDHRPSSPRDDRPGGPRVRPTNPARRTSPRPPGRCPFRHPLWRQHEAAWLRFHPCGRSRLVEGTTEDCVPMKVTPSRQPDVPRPPGMVDPGNDDAVADTEGVDPVAELEFHGSAAGQYPGRWYACSASGTTGQVRSRRSSIASGREADRSRGGRTSRGPTWVAHPPETYRPPWHGSHDQPTASRGRGPRRHRIDLRRRRR